jgi:hypothetical protein
MLPDQWGIIRLEVAMRKKLFIGTLLLMGAFPLATAVPALAQARPATMPKVGEMAPDFKLSYVAGNEEKEVSLSQYRGKKNVVLAFYIFAFTGG